LQLIVQISDTLRFRATLRP